MACAWRVRGVCVTCAWRVRELCVACSRGMCIPYAWRVQVEARELLRQIDRESGARLQQLIEVQRHPTLHVQGT